MSSDSKHPALITLQNTFKKITDVPYCTGTVPLNAQQSLLFYRHKGEPRLIDFASATELELKALADACSPATFGRNQEDVLDESYRKAGKMDSSEFSAQFSPWDSGVIHIAVDTLYKSDGLAANLRAELYKLNVYGPGSFFKAHVDTPHSDKMFGSLVVVLPTPHTGGSLVFRRHNQEYTFDSAKTMGDISGDGPHAAFAAFFSDIEHEVTEVTSGYRVTLTYNLYHRTPSPADNIKIQNDESELSLQKALTSLLSAPSFLKDGGLLAFELSYEYPFNRYSTRPSHLERRLKGVDELLKRVCDALKLDASVKALYREDSNDVIYCFLDYFVQFHHDQIESSLLEYLYEDKDEAAVTLGYDADSNGEAPDVDEYGLDDDAEVLSVVWAKPLSGRNSFEERYIAYGNEASMGCAYGKVCLVVRIKPANERD